MNLTLPGIGEDAEKYMATHHFNPLNRQLLNKVYSSVFDETAPPESYWNRIKIPVLIAHGGEWYLISR
jgi:hypothetical protein